jgi:hypothetical protein
VFSGRVAGGPLRDTQHFRRSPNGAQQAYSHRDGKRQANFSKNLLFSDAEATCLKGAEFPICSQQALKSKTQLLFGAVPSNKTHFS